MAPESTNQSVERAVQLLRAFMLGKPELRVSDIAVATGVGQSTVSRMLSTLESVGLVTRDELSGLYRLGLSHLSFASTALNNHPVHREGRQVAQDLACRLGLGANVAVLHDGVVFYLCNFEGRLAPKSYALMGQRNPLHATGLGKCLLLGVPESERAEVAGELESYTPRTVTDPAELLRQVRAVEGDGYATEVEELALGRACLAAPIRGADGAVVAAISISGPLSAIDLASRREELASVAIEAADSIATGLGFVVGARSGGGGGSPR